MAEQREVGRPVSGDRDGPRLPRDRRVRVVPRPLLQGRRLGPWMTTMLRPIRSILICPIAWPVWRCGSKRSARPWPGCVDSDPGDRLQVGGGRVLRFELIELVSRLTLFERAVRSQSGSCQIRVSPASMRTTRPAVISMIEPMCRRRRTARILASSAKSAGRRGGASLWPWPCLPFARSSAPPQKAAARIPNLLTHHLLRVPPDDRHRAVYSDGAGRSTRRDR